MANLQTYTFRQLVGKFVVAAQAASSFLLDFSLGSVLRAIAQAVSGLFLWLQALALSVVGLTRAATSSGADLDSWMADFNFLRYPGTAASGNVTFSRNIAGVQAVVFLGVQVQTPDGSKVYTVIADPTNPIYSAPIGAYVIPANTTSGVVMVQSTAVTAAGNTSASTITQMTTVIPYVDQVTNLAAFTNGIDPESDASFRARFPGYLQDLSKGTKAALSYAISQANVPAVTYYSLTENIDYATGAARLGYFFVIADDGTGAPSGPFLTNVATAVEATRAFTIHYDVHGPGVVTATFSATLVIAPGFNHSSVTTAVAAALTSYINTTNVGGTVSYGNMLQICFSTVPGAVVGISSAILNGTTVDITCTTKQVIRAGSIGISG